MGLSFFFEKTWAFLLFGAFAYLGWLGRTEGGQSKEVDWSLVNGLMGYLKFWALEKYGGSARAASVWAQAWV